MRRLTKPVLMPLMLVLISAAGILWLGQGLWPIHAAPGFWQVEAADTAVRLRGAFREERDGWTFVHIQGGPGERGFQYGYLMAPEIAEFRLFH